MKSKCPICERECHPQEADIIEQGMKDLAKVVEASPLTKIGGAIGQRIMGKKGESIGKFCGAFLGHNPLGGLPLLFTESKYKFCCPTCSNQWEEEISKADQKEISQAIMLIKETPSLRDKTSEEKNKHIEKIESLISVFKTKESVEITILLYNSLAYSQLILKENPQKALSAIDDSLDLDPKNNISLAIKGMILCTSEDSLDYYGAMKCLVHYKEIKDKDFRTLFKETEFSERFEKLTQSYINNFLDIPTSERKFLVIDDHLRRLPDTVLVLPHNKLPENILFPEGGPLIQELYVVHPYKPNVYLPYNGFNFHLLKDQAEELAYIMECLGAKSISWSQTLSEATDQENEDAMKAAIGGEYKGYGGKVGFENDNKNRNAKERLNGVLENKEFNITRDKRPTIPKNLIWYPHCEKWQKESKSRLEGRLHKLRLEINTLESTVISTQERNMIEVALEAMVVKAEGNYEKSKKISLKTEKSLTYTVEIEFYPLSEYNVQ